MPGSLTTPGRPGARDDAPECVAFRHLHGVGTQNRNLSRLNGWPMRPPVNASPRPSRATAHDSGPMWIATPSSQETCTLYSLPVSWRFADVFCLAFNNRHRSIGSAGPFGAMNRLMRCNKNGTVSENRLSGVQLMEQRFCLLQIERVEALCEPLIDLGDCASRFVPLPLVAE